ncbi:hypothetical protein [Streptomyces sp. CAU 1734]|uniref:hypothetical protein n=1 Tax=Streptomyces sp. CAU 1734 TaxID=3140360 RepID=UPI00326178B2
MDTEKTAGPIWTVGRGVSVGLLMFVLVALLWNIVRFGGSGDDDAPKTERLARPGSVQVEYRVLGSATGADLTWTDGRGQTSQASGKAVPLTSKDGRPLGFVATRGASLYLSAQNTGASGDLTCEIVVNGHVIAKNTSSGGYTVVTCQATA